MLRTKKRFLYMVISGVIISLLFKYILQPVQELHHNLLIDIASITIVTVIIWEGNLQVDKWLNKQYSWIQETKKRLLVQVLISSLFTIVMLANLIVVFHLIVDRNDDVKPNGIDPLFVPAIIIAFGILLIDIGTQFFKSWKLSLIEVEKYKTESTIAQLQNLKKQLNPHFLFNNLSVLSSLVYKDQDKAAEFISELSKVYRYTMDNENTELITLQTELEFIKHYIYLLSIRFDKGITFTINIEENKKQYLIPPMCLQILIENTIQHNEVSQSNPLQVSVYTKEHLLIIENPIHARTDTSDSSKTGIKNIQLRYNFFTEEKVIITHTEDVFRIALPLFLHYESGNY